MVSVDVAFAARCVNDKIQKGTVTVVIDVLRATSVMITAFEYGAKEIIPVLTPDEAFNLKKEIGDDVLLGGERNAEKIPGFDFDNSPFSYMNGRIIGKTIIMTTTNGTEAIRAAEYSDEVIIGSFLNAKKVVSCLTRKNRILFLCAGTDGNYTIEDGLCAGYMIDLLNKSSNVGLTDSARIVHSFYERNKNDIIKAAELSRHYSVLRQKGFYKDLDYCLQTDVSDILPVYSDMAIKKQAK
ncbi:MAG: 2-phosphosulfolactate phosphatase [Chlorobi bacterium]|nr:2-phosphosulfolactate phosphatase [Chlorobiota bacterium]